MLLGMWLHDDPFSQRIREDTYWNPPMVVILIKEEFSLIFMRRYYQQIEVVIYFLLLKLPVFIVEVVLNPHKPLIDQFWDN